MSKKALEFFLADFKRLEELLIAIPFAGFAVWAGVATNIAVNSNNYVNWIPDEKREIPNVTPS